jgi:hypothetical protein
MANQYEHEADWKALTEVLQCPDEAVLGEVLRLIQAHDSAVSGRVAGFRARDYLAHQLDCARREGRLAQLQVEALEAELSRPHVVLDRMELGLHRIALLIDKSARNGEVPSGLAAAVRTLVSKALSV